MTNGVSPRRRGLLIGAGYFSGFHLDAWQRMPDAEIVCICDLDGGRARRAADRYGVADVETDARRALERDDFDFVDIATQPPGRLELIQLVAERRLPMICQKPLAADLAAAEEIVAAAERAAVPFMVHENFRFQPWYREIKRLLDAGVIGHQLHTISMRSRMGDGWGADAYLDRQPYFRTMPRFLIHETGVHFVDTFRFLAGEIVECTATLRRLNPAIAGEDAALLNFRFSSGAHAQWDANRFNESMAEDPRYTFGEMLVEADQGSLWLDCSGRITIKPLGEPARPHSYAPPRTGFAGDCVFACQQHFLEFLNGSLACETSGAEYLKTLRVVEALYDSARRGRAVALSAPPASCRRVVDLSLPISGAMPGVSIAASKSIEADGWNATTLSLYSHAGTHLDAPKHFLPDGRSLDQQDLSVCCGRARVVNLAPAQPRQLLTVADIRERLGTVYPGDRLLLRTDWHKRFGTPSYRDELPRISVELARWLVEHKVALLGVEPPSVADVNNLSELTEVHQTLFRGGVLVVEGLANLDQLTRSEVEFVALPLFVVGGDGSPVRAVAIEESEVTG